MNELPTTLPYRPGDVSWRVGREPTVGLASSAALLLQVCHPSVAAGVHQYSDFERQPWTRLWRTLDIVLKLAFGSPAVSAEQTRILRRMHERVKGTRDDGATYNALDPDLMLWVWATLAWGALEAYELVFARLTDVERERYYQEQKLLAHGSGVPEGHCPATYAEFTGYFDRMVRDELHTTEVAKNVLRLGLRPPVFWPLRPMLGRVNGLTLGLLPNPIRDRLLAEAGHPWTPKNERALRRLIARNRFAVRIIPRRIRELPTAYLVSRKRPLKLFQRGARKYAPRPPQRLAS
jgi:uncharacterized protein (DUF2236 family)